MSRADLWPLCGCCGDRTRNPRVAHLALRRFSNWSGTWLNSVVCDGRTVTGSHPSAPLPRPLPEPQAVRRAS